MYQVVIERRAEKDLDRLAQPVRRRVSESILSLADNPRPSGCRKLVGGDYRVIYQISDEVRVIRISRVRRRREVYN